MTIPQYDGLAPVIDRYDALIVDLWGVLHNGIHAFAGAPECLGELKSRGKRICLLTNAPRRPHGIRLFLENMGIGPDLYDHLVTSGEAVHEALRDRTLPAAYTTGRRLLHLGPPRDRDVFVGLDYIEAFHPEDADVLLMTDILHNDETLADYEQILRRCRRFGLPMVCANPDLVVVVGSKDVICAGVLATRYAELGGTVVLFGKPHAPIYETCFRLLGVEDRSRILAIGDGLRTDIAGAGAVGIDSAFIISGIHAAELSVAWGEAADPAKLARLVATIGPKPSFAIPRLTI